MRDVVLRTNAIPVYGFLSLIESREPEGETPSRPKILDCGAGGPVPPLALFYQHGFQCWGIDTSETQLDRARQFCQELGIELNLRPGDMRQIPFEDETFDYVYEHYSMCHLSKRDTARAVGEIHRVLKRGGLCFLGVILTDTWPTSLFGQEEEPGEFWGEEGGQERTLHSMFTSREADELVSAFEILSRETHIRYLRETAEGTTLEAWMGLHAEAPEAHSREQWRARYGCRANSFQYAHTYYFLRKP